MTFGGSGENPTTIPSRQHSEPPIREPDQPPGKSRLFFENVVKWGGIGLVVLFLVLFAYTATSGFEDDLTDAQVTQTQVARDRE